MFRSTFLPLFAATIVLTISSTAAQDQTGECILDGVPCPFSPIASKLQTGLRENSSQRGGGGEASVENARLEIHPDIAKYSAKFSYQLRFAAA